MSHGMRRTMPFAAVISVMALVLSACGGGEPAAAPTPARTAAPTSAPAVATAQPLAVTATPAPAARPTATTAPTPTATAVPVPTGELRFAFQDLQDQGMHPDSPGRRRYLDPMYDWMIGSNREGKLDAAVSVLSSWTTNADSTAWTVKVRDGVVFHNGDKATSKDIKASFDYTYRDGSIHTQSAATKRQIKSIDLPDAGTAVITLTSSRIFFPVEFLSDLDSNTVSYLMPADYMAKSGDAEFSKKPVGSGPYTLKENSIGNKIVYQATSKHWYYGVPRYATMEFRTVPEGTTRMALLKTSGADVIDIGNKDVKPAREAGFKIYSKDGASVTTIWPHQQWDAGNPLGNVLVRRALSLAIDRQLIVDTFFSGLGTPSVNYPLQVKDVAFVRTPVPKQDLAQARKLLAESGLGTVSLDVHIFSQGILEGVEIMEAVAVWWEQIGVKVNRIPTTYATYRDKRNVFAFKTPTVGGAFAVSTRPVGTLQVTGPLSKASVSRVTEDPAVKPYVDAVVAAKTIDEYTKTMRDAQNFAFDQMYLIVLAETGTPFAANAQKVPSFYPGAGPLNYNVLDIIDPRK